jgi:hypothetical protein
VFLSDDAQNLEELMKKIGNASQQRPIIAGQIGLLEGGYLTNAIPCSVAMNQVIKSRGLNSSFRDDHYPRHFMPFYLFGSPEQYHISHMLLQAPNINLSASNVKFCPELHTKVSELLKSGKGLILTLSDYREATMQPFPLDNNNDAFDSGRFFFKPRQSFEVKVWIDPKGPSANGPGLLDDLSELVGQGQMDLGEDVYWDVGVLNKDPFADETNETPWDEELNAITSVLNTATV